MNLPDRTFYLLGMGHRRKLLYRDGALTDLGTRRALRQWIVSREWVVPEDYAVVLRTRRGGDVRVYEDESGIFVDEDGERTRIAEGAVRLPRFDDRPHADLLRALHQELLVNIVPAGPVPNLLVYPKPWYRDAAMVAMCLGKTGNLRLIEDWVTGLRDPFDRNNAGHCEPDNLGQALYLASLFAGTHHPIVASVLEQVPRYVRGKHLTGTTDFAEHPVYQTKWLKLGLRALGLDDPYAIPEVVDSYSSLFWMDYRDHHVPGPRFDAGAAENYPYLAWAEAHFHGDGPPAPLDTTRYPLTWEAHASEARYEEMAVVDAEYVARGIAAPHSWHAAEMFLYLWDKGTGA